MTITREDVADLREGDVVEYRDERFPDVVTRGPLRLIRRDGDGVALGEQLVIRHSASRAPGDTEAEHGLLTVVSRAPRPLYVNHPRTEPVPGDVVRREGSNDEWSYTFKGREAWAGSKSAGRLTAWVSTTHGSPDTGPHNAPKGLRLLVDGETGQVVP